MEAWPQMSLGVGELKIKKIKRCHTNICHTFTLLLIGMSHSLSPFWSHQSAADTQKMSVWSTPVTQKKRGTGALRSL